MESQKISLDLHERTKVSVIFQAFFSLLCFSAAAWLLIKLIQTYSITGSNIIAVLFLFSFGLWELLSVTGTNERFIIFSADTVTIKDRYFSKPVIYRQADISLVAFRTLSFIIVSSDGKKDTVKLGNYYQEKTVKILESLNLFCKRNSIKVEGLEQDTEN